MSSSTPANSAVGSRSTPSLSAARATASAADTVRRAAITTGAPAPPRRTRRAGRDQVDGRQARLRRAATRVSRRMVRRGDAFASCLDEARGLSLHTPHCRRGRETGRRSRACPIARRAGGSAARRDAGGARHGPPGGVRGRRRGGRAAVDVADAADGDGHLAALGGNHLARSLRRTAPSATPDDAGHRHPGGDQRAQDPCASVSERHEGDATTGTLRGR